MDVQQPTPKTVKEWESEERRLFGQLVDAANNGKLDRFNIPFDMPTIPRTASDSDRCRFYMKICDQYKKALRRLV